ncbi:MAG: purine-nucleoside phosphorylase [Planctomycetes bacterium]|nr:purine-nucleoside phosphorylase [Planctomycetota bacterium]
MSADIAQDLKPALQHLSKAGISSAPEIAIILGSGFGAIENLLTSRISIAYGDIPDFPKPAGTAGHKCRLSIGKIGERSVALFRGRYHLYEDFTPRQLALCVRLAHAMGIKSLLVTNAAGGIRPDLAPDSLMLITDHIHLLGANPLSGPSAIHGAPQFPPMAGAYDAGLSEKLAWAAEAVGEKLFEGVYASVPGPNFETAAEVRMLGILGADAVGMSTTPEVIIGHALGMKVAGLSLITNRAGSIDDSHIGTLMNAAENADRVKKLIAKFVSTQKSEKP